MKESSRHHYIPQFYIKGFTNNKGIIYVYDKQSDKIWNRQITPKGIFYDLDRNTIFNENDSSSIIEDYWLKHLDTECSKIVKKFRESKNSTFLHNINDVSRLKFFLIHLYWRLPKIDFAFDYLFENATILNLKGENIKPINKDYKKEGFKKIDRLLLPNKIIRGIKNQRLSGGFYSKLFEKNENIFLLGDYPMLYKTEPTCFDEILNKEVLLPISSKRLYAISNHNSKNFDFSKVTTFNTLIINQSVRYVCGTDKVFLEKSVDYYKKQKQFLPLDYLRDKLFE